MNKEDANAVVEKAMARGMAKLKGISEENFSEQAMQAEEFQNLALIYMAELSDWTIQLAYLIGDQRWEEARNALPPSRIAIDKLAGAVNNMLIAETPKKP